MQASGDDLPTTLAAFVNTPTCTGVPGDVNMGEGDNIPITAAFDICAAVLTGAGMNTLPAGNYFDTVTYSIVP